MYKYEFEVEIEITCCYRCRCMGTRPLFCRSGSGDIVDYKYICRFSNKNIEYIYGSKPD